MHARNRLCAIYTLRAMHSLQGRPVDFADRDERTIFVLAAVAFGANFLPMIRVSAGEDEPDYNNDWPRRLRKQLREMPQSLQDAIAAIVYRALQIEVGVYARRKFSATFLKQ